MLKEGDKAPHFSLQADSGDRVSLADFAGKTLVLYFYPRDSTPGCTREAQAFSAARAALEAAGASVVGVSRDSVKSHCTFRDKFALTIPLLSDPDLSVHRAYGAWGTKTMYGKKVEGCIRSTFLVRDGRIARAFSNVKVDGHADQVLQAVGEIAHGPSSRAFSPSAARPAKAPSSRAGLRAREVASAVKGRAKAVAKAAAKKVRAKAAKVVRAAKAAGAVKKSKTKR